MSSSEELLDALRKVVVLGDVWKARKIAEQAVNQGLPANDGLEELIGAMREVDEKYERKEFFVIDVAGILLAPSLANYSRFTLHRKKRDAVGKAFSSVPVR